MGEPKANPLYDLVASQIPNYCHALEVTGVHDLLGTIEEVINQNPGFKEEDYITFFETMEGPYYIGPEEDKEEEERVYAVSFRDYIEGSIE